MVHIPTRTTIYIDATVTEETRTVMRAELIAIYTALTTFAEHDWLGYLLINDQVSKPYGITTPTHVFAAPYTTTTTCCSQKASRTY